jgi:uncharacterized membrane protein
MKNRSGVADESVVQPPKKEHVAGVRSIDAQGRERNTPVMGGIRLEEAITIGRPISDVYSYWRDFTNFPKFCKQLREVVVLDKTRSRWTANGPNDKPLTWEAAMLEDKPNELISWRSLENAEFENAGSVSFREAPAGRGTEIRWTLTYNPPAGPIGSLIAKLTGREPAILLREQLRRLKQLLETGEIATTDGQAAVIDS